MARIASASHVAIMFEGPTWRGAHATVIAAVACAALAIRAGAQQTDSTVRDSAVVLTPIEVSGSVTPSVGPDLAAIASARMSALGASRLNAYRPSALPEALAQQPGISLYDDLGSSSKLGITSRGFLASPVVGTPQGLSVFLDGVRENEPDAAEVNFDLLPMSAVRRVELVSGTASLQGANSLGGVINLVTPHGSGPLNGDVEMQAGSWGAFGLDGSAGGSTSGGLSYYTAGDYHREDGWRQMTGANRETGLVNVGRLARARGWNAQVLLSRSLARTAGSLPAAVFDARPDSNLTAGDDEDLSLAQVTLSAYRRLGDGRASLRVWDRNSYGRRLNANQAGDPDSRNLSDASTLGYSGDYRWAGAERGAIVSLRAGTDGSVNAVRVRLFDDSAKFGGGESLTTFVRSPLWDVSGFGAADVGLGPLTLSGGARYDYVRIPYRDQLTPSNDGTASYARFEPKGGVTVNAGGGLTMYASAGASFRAPALIELACADPAVPCALPYSLGADPPIRPVGAVTCETGLTWARGRVVAQGSAYRSDVTDDIFLFGRASPATRSTVDGYFGNIPHTRRAGLNVDLSADLGQGRSTYLSATWSRATFRGQDTLATPMYASGVEVVRAGDVMPLVPPLTVKLGARVPLRAGFVFQTDGRYVGPRYLRGDEANAASPLDAYFVADARVAWRAGDWEIAGLVTNILNRRYAAFGTFNVNEGAATEPIQRFLTPGAERSVRVVVRRSFGPDPEPGEAPPGGG